MIYLPYVVLWELLVPAISILVLVCVLWHDLYRGDFGGEIGQCMEHRAPVDLTHQLVPVQNLECGQSHVEIEHLCKTSGRRFRSGVL